ncbi:MAG: ChaN family lipoprotein [Methyloligellaceae bacterium]
MNRQIVSSILMLFFITAQSVTNTAHSQSPFKNWLSLKNQSHPLTGKIWSTVDKKFISANELVSRLAIRNYILMGETHDNADHHRLHAWLIGKVVRYDRKPKIVMEMIREDQAQALKSYMSRVRSKKQPKPAENLGPALQWNEKWGYDWKIYQPIASAAFAGRLTIKAGSASKEAEAKFKKSSFFNGMTAQERRRLGVDEKFSLSVLNSLKDEMNKSHCNALPYSALQSMSHVQRYRDAILADNLIKAARPFGSVLIAGNGHIRNDRGVPYYIARRIKNASMITLAMQEVSSDQKTPGDYLPATAGTKPVYDYIWFTPAQSRKDPCLAFKKK